MLEGVLSLVSRRRNVSSITSDIDNVGRYTCEGEIARREVDAFELKFEGRRVEATTKSRMHSWQQVPCERVDGHGAYLVHSILGSLEIRVCKTLCRRLILKKKYLDIARTQI